MYVPVDGNEVSLHVPGDTHVPPKATVFQYPFIQVACTPVSQSPSIRGGWLDELLELLDELDELLELEELLVQHPGGSVGSASGGESAGGGSPEQYPSVENVFVNVQGPVLTHPVLIGEGSLDTLLNCFWKMLSIQIHSPVQVNLHPKQVLASPSII